MKKATSETHPIRVDFVPDDGRLGPGRLGLTFAPGKKAPGRHADWHRDLEMDLARLAEEYGTEVLVSLLESWEYEEFRIADLPDAAARNRIEFLHFPIRDTDVPAQMNAAVSLVEQILERLGSEKTVVVHCRGGVGRTGTIAACCLIAVGYEADAAIATVRKARHNAVENPRQRNFVHEFAAEWRRGESQSDGPAS